MFYGTPNWREKLRGARRDCPVGDQCIVRSACVQPDQVGVSTPPRLAKYAKHTLIGCHGGEGSFVFAIRKGLVAPFTLSETGRETILGLLGQGQMFGQGGLFAAEARPFAALTCTEAELCRFPTRDLEELIKTDPKLAERVIGSLADSLWEAARQLEIQNQPLARNRIRALLESAAGQLGGQLEEGGLPLTHEQLAYMAGVNRVTVTRALRELEEEGFVRRERGRVQVVIAPKAK